MNNLHNLDPVELLVVAVLAIIALGVSIVVELRTQPAPAPVRVNAVRMLHAAGYSQRKIADQLGITRHQVRKELAM